MKRNTRYQNRMQIVMAITLGWTLFACISFISEYFFVRDLIAIKRLAGSYEFWQDFAGVMILGIIGGFVGGCFLVFKMGSRYRKKSFAFGILNSGLIFIITYLALAVAGLFIMDLIYFLFTASFFSAVNKSLQNVLFNIRTPSFFINMFVWAFLMSGTQFLLQVSDKFGPGILWKFVTGKYYHPREEERIFMFLDLKSSTAIAEKTGSNKFFKLLKEIYADITEPIMNSRGEIYQYVGDEVVVSWPVEKGLSGNNCLLCFFSIQQALVERKKYYLNEYGLIPSFKAGVHIGEATVGEIGIIKKDIVFSGDVLNTTSRIQEECNKHNVNIIMSSELLRRMPMNGFKKISLGEIKLKGREEKLALSTIEAA
ncbi:MAG: adenylate/guanylate cyclase domain-containing protein [Bacteroidetes bacterium]|nr:MAG: adenylate/guanylate cyclase domain-containing protein [Bacteroidota bacterium]